MQSVRPDSLDMAYSFCFHDHDIINKYAYYLVVDFYKSDKDTVVYIDLLETEFLK